MKAQNIYTVPYRRKREGRTNYKKRLKLLQSGKSRLVIRKSLKGIYASLVNYGEKGDLVIASASAADLKKLGWAMSAGNLPSAYLVGLILGTRAKKAKIAEAVLDVGLYSPIKKSRIYAALAGCLDAGINVPHGDDVLPGKDRIEGKHIASYAAKADSNSNQFASYRKTNDPNTITSVFQETKAKILRG